MSTTATKATSTPRPAQRQIKLVPTDQLKANDYNPNEMTGAQFRELVSEVRHLGRLPKPIIARLNCDAYEIIDGEHNWRAATELGMAEVPVEVIEADDFESMRQTYKRNQHGTHDPVLLGRMFARMLHDRGLSRRELAKAIKVTEGTIRNALLYAEVAEVRNSYAPADSPGAVAATVAAMSVRTLRLCRSLHPAIANAWINEGADEKKLWSAMRTNSWDDRSRMTRRYENLKLVVDLLGFGEGSFASRIKMLRWRRDVFDYYDFIPPDELAPYLRVLPEHHVNGLSRLLDAMLDDEADKPRFLLTPDELAATTAPDEWDGQIGFDDDRIRDAVLTKTGRVPVERSSKPDEIRERLQAAEIEQGAPDYVKASKAPASVRYNVWKWDGDYSGEGKVSDDVKAAFLAGLDDDADLKHRQVRHGLQQTEQDLHAKEKLDTLTPVEVAVQLAEVILGEQGDEAAALGAKMAECIEHRWLIAMHDSVEMFHKTKQRQAEMLAFFSRMRR